MLSNTDYKSTYLSWMDRNIQEIRVNDKTTRLVFPFLDFCNDHIEISIADDLTKVIVSDDGETIANLFLSGIEVNANGKYKSILQEVTILYGVTITTDKELIISCSQTNFGNAINRLLQCIMKLNDILIIS